MVNDANNSKLSRCTSQTEFSDKSSSTCLRNQSSCSSLTSGIGHSDQSICNGKTIDKGQSEQQLQNQFHNIPLDDNIETPTTSNDIKTETVVDDSGQTLGLDSDNHIGDKYGRQQKLKTDIKKFVDVIFTDSQSISLEKKAQFGQLMQNSEARLLFAMSVDDYRVNSKRVSELTFYSLAQYFSIVLLECLLAEDFRPAKIIMNMMFTYYYEQNYDKIPPRDRPQLMENSATDEPILDTDYDSQPRIIKTYLYTQLKEQEIFKSIRFWTSAFYESVIIERNNHPVFVDKQRGKSNAIRDEEMDCSKNITFGLLGSFIHNMCLLELNHEFCQEFLDKHSTIAGLSNEQLDMLRSNLKSMFSENSSSGQAPLSHSTASERLSLFLQKWSNRLNQSNTTTNHSKSNAQI